MKRARKFSHVGFDNEVAEARAGGGTSRVLCGRNIHPLPDEQLALLPTCPTCTRVRDAQPRVVRYSFTVRGFTWPR